MTIKSKIEKHLNQLVQRGLKYQLAECGGIKLTPKTTTTVISNDFLVVYSLKFISSERYEFDGGIQLNFTMLKELGERTLKVLGNNSLTVRVYNFEDPASEEDLDEYLIETAADLNELMTEVEITGVGDKELTELEGFIGTFVKAREFEELETLSILKL